MTLFGKGKARKAPKINTRDTGGIGIDARELFNTEDGREAIRRLLGIEFRPTPGSTGKMLDLEIALGAAVADARLGMVDVADDSWSTGKMFRRYEIEIEATADESVNRDRFLAECHRLADLCFSSASAVSEPLQGAEQLPREGH